MRVSVCISTFGSQDWADLAWSRAYPSAVTAAEKVRGEVIVEHQPDGTIASARNAAADRAKGDWLCFLDADDELDPDYLLAMEAGHWSGSKQLVLLVPRVSYIRATAVMNYDGTNPTNIEAPIFPNQGQWPGVNVAVIGTLVSRALFLKVGGFREDEFPYEDYSLWLRCFRAGATLVEVGGAIYRAHVRSDSAHRDPAGLDWRRELHQKLLAEHYRETGANALR